MSAEDARQHDEHVVDPLFGLAAEFESSEALLAATRRVAEAGYTRAEAYSPFPVEGVAEALGMRRTRVAMVVLIGAILGASTGFGMQWFANVIHYPWNIGGKPPNSWPMFIPITFELGILFAAVSGVIAMIVMNRLPQPYHPMFKLDAFERATRDRFFLCIEAADPRFELGHLRALLESTSPVAIMEVPT